jgi:hypothetical protein
MLESLLEFNRKLVDGGLKYLRKVSKDTILNKVFWGGKFPAAVRGNIGGEATPLKKNIRNIRE